MEKDTLHIPSLPLSLTDVPAAIDSILDKLFRDRTTEFSSIDPSIGHAISILESFTMNGAKRIRPLFLWAGVRCTSSENINPTAYLRAGAALELLQSCALIHDDILDSSHTRRGLPTVHRRYEQEHIHNRWAGDAESYGRSMGILLGDLALSWSDDLFSLSGIPEAQLSQAREPWRLMRTEVIAGQILDITMENSSSEKPHHALLVNQYKTASYTIKRPLHLGAALAGATQDLQNLLCRFGEKIGLAYQLRDDILGVFGDPCVTGKPSGDDLRSGKRTYLVTTAIQNLGSEAHKLQEGLGTAQEDSDIEVLKEIITRSGALSTVENQIQSLTEEALDILNTAPIEDSIRKELHTITLKLVTRER